VQRRALLQANLDTATATCTEQETLITESEAAQEQARTEREAANEANVTALAELKAAKEDLEAKVKAIAAHLKDSEQKRIMVENMGGYIADMGTAMKLFTLLRDRSKPVEEAPAEVQCMEVLVTEETTAVTEEAMPVADVEMAA